jgi:hypothetical protein
MHGLAGAVDDARPKQRKGQDPRSSLPLDETEQVGIAAVLVGQKEPVRGPLADPELGLRNQRGGGASGQSYRRRYGGFDEIPAAGLAGREAACAFIA